jgi:hypothetical protein
VSVTSRAGLGELLLTLLRSLVVLIKHTWISSYLVCHLCTDLTYPVTRVDVVGDDAVPHRAHGRKNIPSGRKVGWTHVGGLHADDVDERLFETRHLAREVGSRHGAKVLWMTP